MSIHLCKNAVHNAVTPEILSVQTAQPAARSPLLYLREDELDAGVNLILDTSRALLDLAAGLAGAKDLTGPEFRVLIAVRQPAGVGVLALASVLGITKQGLMRTLEITEARGLTERRRDPRDGRGRLVCLTAQGRTIEQTISLALRNRLARAYRKAGSDAVNGAHAVLRAVLDDGPAEATKR